MKIINLSRYLVATLYLMVSSQWSWANCHALPAGDVPVDIYSLQEVEGSTGGWVCRRAPLSKVSAQWAESALPTVVKGVLSIQDPVRPAVGCSSSSAVAVCAADSFFAKSSAILENDAYKHFPLNEESTAIYEPYLEADRQIAARLIELQKKKKEEEERAGVAPVQETALEVVDTVVAEGVFGRMVGWLSSKTEPVVRRVRDKIASWVASPVDQVPLEKLLPSSDGKVAIARVGTGVGMVTLGVIGLFPPAQIVTAPAAVTLDVGSVAVQGVGLGAGRDRSALLQKKSEKAGLSTKVVMTAVKKGGEAGLKHAEILAHAGGHLLGHGATEALVHGGASAVGHAVPIVGTVWTLSKGVRVAAKGITEWVVGPGVGEELLLAKERNNRNLVKARVTQLRRQLKDLQGIAWALSPKDVGTRQSEYLSRVNCLCEASQWLDDLDRKASLAFEERIQYLEGALVRRAHRESKSVPLIESEDLIEHLMEIDRHAQDLQTKAADLLRALPSIEAQAPGLTDEIAAVKAALVAHEGDREEILRLQRRIHDLKNQMERASGRHQKLPLTQALQKAITERHSLAEKWVAEVEPKAKALMDKVILAGITVEEPIVFPRVHLSPIDLAAQKGDADRLRGLVHGETVHFMKKNAFGFTPLQLAILSGNLDAVKVIWEKLSKDRVNPAYLLAYFKTLLPDRSNLFHLAIRSGNLDILKYLFDRFSRLPVRGTLMDEALHLLNQADRYGSTPTHQAALMGNLEALSSLGRWGAHLEIPDSNGATPLMIAAGAGQVEAVQMLMDKSAKVDRVQRDGLTAIDLAVRGGHAAVAAVLLPVFRERKPEWLRAAIEGNHPELLGTLIGDARLKSKLPELAKKAGGQLTVFAVQNKHSQLVRAMAAGGVDFSEAIVEVSEGEGSGKRRNLLQVALQQRDEATAQALIDSGVNFLTSSRSAFENPLFEAAQLGLVDTVNHMIEKTESFKGSELSDFTIHYKSQVDSARRSSPVQGAVLGGHLELVKLLKSKGFSFSGNGKKIRAEDLFHAAVRSGSLEMVKYLVEEVGSGDVRLKGPLGRSPRALASELGYSQIAEYLDALGIREDAI